MCPLYKHADSRNICTASNIIDWRVNFLLLIEQISTRKHEVEYNFFVHILIKLLYGDIKMQLNTRL